MNDVLVLRVARPGDVCLPGFERSTDRVQARDEFAVVSEHVERSGSHAGHRPHRHGDIRGVGDLDADVRDRRSERAHREGNDVHRAAAHAAPEKTGERVAHLDGVLPVVGRPGVALVLATDEGPVLDPRHVRGIRSRPVAVRAACRRESRVKVPVRTSRSQSRSYSSAEPSHHSTLSGLVRAAISSTQSRSLRLAVGGVIGWCLRSASVLRWLRVDHMIACLTTSSPGRSPGQRGREVGDPMLGMGTWRRTNRASSGGDPKPAQGGATPTTGDGGELEALELIAASLPPPPPDEVWIGDDAAVVVAARRAGCCSPSTSSSKACTPTSRSWGSTTSVGGRSRPP